MKTTFHHEDNVGWALPTMSGGARPTGLVWIASIDDLLTMKRIAGRTKDKLDIEALEKIRRGEDPNG